jgi:hypothetical protein
MRRSFAFVRFGFALVLALGALAVSTSVVLADKPQKSEVTATSTFEVTDVCSFPVTIVSNADIMAIHYFDQSGALIRIFNHVIEQDTFSANGNTLVGSPFTFNIEALFASDGTLTSLTASGIVEKVQLPDGSVFFSAGRVDYLAHPDSQFILTSDAGHSGNVAAFCAALA